METETTLPLPSSLRARSFRRAIAPPVATARGTRTTREGWYLRWTDAKGCHGYGEVAPLPPFGGGDVETTGAAIRELQGGAWRDPWNFLRSQDPGLSSLAFGLWSASQGPCPDSIGTPPRLPNTFLAEAGDFETQCKVGRLNHFKTFKVKSIPGETPAEMDRLLHCLNCLQADEQLRIDPNGSWSVDFLETFMKRAHRHPSLEFVEQPLTENQAAVYRNLPLPWQKKIALDESVNNPVKWREWKDWPGVLVIKPSLFGIPEWLASSPDRVVLSSAFETEIGFSHLLRLAESYRPKHPVGFGTARFTGLSRECQGAQLHSRIITRSQIESTWDKAGEDR